MSPKVRAANNWVMRTGNGAIFGGHRPGSLNRVPIA